MKSGESRLVVVAGEDLIVGKKPGWIWWVGRVEVVRWGAEEMSM
jgi:hypothetical protein